MLGPALSWLGCCGGAGLGGKGGGERRWRDPKWAPAINIMPFDLPHIMIMIIYIPLLVCYDSIAITPGKGGKRRGSLICVLLAILCVLLLIYHRYIYLFLKHEYFITKFFINSIQLTIGKEKWKDLKIFLNLGGKRFHDLNFSKWTKEGLNAFQQDSLLPWCPDYAATC